MLSRRFFLATASAFFLARPIHAAQTITLFAAASLKTTLDALVTPLRSATGIDTRCVYAASSALARQIEQGAPADLFWSADREWMDWCAARNLIYRDSVIDLLSNRLVIIAPVDATHQTIAFTARDFEAVLGTGRIATGETRSVPAGRYAKNALQTLGLWDRFASRLAETDNVRSALLLVARGETPLGIVYASDAKAEPRVKILAEFPATAHRPIVYPLAITATARLDPSRAAVRFLQTPAAQDIFIRDGFSILPLRAPA